LIQARQKFFGIENVDDKGRVDRDKVIFLVGDEHPRTSYRFWARSQLRTIDVAVEHG